MTGPIPLLASERIILRPLADSDADGAYPAWLNDQTVCAGNSHGAYPYSRDAARAFIAKSQGPDRLVLAMVLKEDGRHIGNIALQSIHPIYRKAEFAILLGDSSAWGKGYGKEAGLVLCRHGFDRLNLHRIECGTFSTNVAMQRLAVALGMREEGRRREAAFTGGRYQDIIEFGMTRNDFRAFHPYSEAIHG